MTPNWSPFILAEKGAKADPPRPIHTFEGKGDRMRSAAFAELQAREAFQWGADHFTDAPDGLRRAWRALAVAEDRHLGWLLKRMEALGIPIDGRRVSDQLWHSLIGCVDARDFAHFMSSAEDRGRRAGERFEAELRNSDPETARIFGQIAEEEVAHIRLAFDYFPVLPKP